MVDNFGVPVTLTKREMSMGADCGIMRNIASMADGLHPANGFDEERDDAWNIHIEGACGEIAAAKVMGRFWSPTVNIFKAPDIGKTIQVRTRSRHSYELYVRPGDNPDHCFVLVTGRAPDFRVRGYLMAFDARNDAWLKNHGGRPPAWFVPHCALHDIAPLILVG
jgi:hypothetical protein